MLHTDAEGSESEALAIALMPGWTETIGGAILKATHAGLSHRFPAASVDTHATYGTDGTLPHYNPLEIGRQTVELAAHEIIAAYERLHGSGRVEPAATSFGAGGLDHEQAINHFGNTLSHYISLGIGEKAIRLAAQKSFDVFVPLYEGKRTVLVATSMSAAVLARMEEINQDAGKPLDIVGRVLYAPCLVPPEKARAVMLGRFATHLVSSTFDELVRDNSPREAISLINNTLHSRPPVSDLFRIIGLGIALLEGTPVEMSNLLAEQGLHLVQGMNDCLRNTALEQHPGVIAKLLPGQGHSMSMNSANRVDAIAQEITDLGVYQPR